MKKMIVNPNTTMAAANMLGNGIAKSLLPFAELLE